MSKEVKRYEAVHIRYEDGNIRYGEGCEVEVVTAADYDALLAEFEALMKWKQTAEYWYGQYRLVKHGESPAEYPTEGKLDGWHNSYHKS